MMTGNDVVLKMTANVGPRAILGLGQTAQSFEGRDAKSS